MRFGHDNRFLAIGREVHVVGIVDRDFVAGLARFRIDRGQAAVNPAFGIIGNSQRLQIP